MSLWVCGALPAPLALAQAGAPWEGVVAGGAAPPPPMPVLLNANAPIPANGGVLIESLGASPVVHVERSDMPGVEVDGTLTMLEGGRYVWVPAAGFAPGQSYVVTASSNPGWGPVSDASATITVAPAIAKTAPAVTSAPVATRHELDAGSACCSAVPGVPAVPQCFATGKQAYVQLDTALQSPATATVLGQFLFRARTGAPPPIFQPFGPFVLSYSMTADQYCFELDALEITTAIMHTYTDLSPRCAKPDVAGPLGQLAFDVLAGGGLDRSVCPLPPTGYEAQWCTANEAACAEQRDRDGCEGYGHVCAGEPLPEPPLAGSGGAAGAWMSAAGSGGLGGATAGSAAAPFDAQRASREDASFCAAVRVGARSRLPALAVLVVLLSVLRARSARRRVERDA